jgi:hypothetical protein
MYISKTGFVCISKTVDAINSCFQHTKLLYHASCIALKAVFFLYHIFCTSENYGECGYFELHKIWR